MDLTVTQATVQHITSAQEEAPLEDIVQGGTFLMVFSKPATTRRIFRVKKELL